MSFNASKAFMSFLTDMHSGDFDVAIKASGGHTIKCALYPDTITPNQLDTPSSRNAYNGAGGQWLAANELISTTPTGGSWVAGGLALSISILTSANVYAFGAANKSGSTSDTIAAVKGVLIYDDTSSTPVQDQGICYMAFPGPQTVSGGQFVVAFNAAGILQETY